MPFVPPHSEKTSTKSPSTSSPRVSSTGSTIADTSQTTPSRSPANAFGLEEPEESNICSLVIGDRRWQVVYDRKIIILSNAASSEGYSMILRRN